MKVPHNIADKLIAQVDPVGDIDIPGGVPQDVSDLTSFIQTLFTVAFAFAGVAAVAFIIVGGYTIMAAGGDPQKMKKGQDTLIYAIAGLVIVVCAALFVEFVARLLGVENLILFLNLPSV